MTIQANAGDHLVELSGLPANCTASGGSSRNVDVSTGGLTRDTARVAFEVHCERIWHLALTRRGDEGDRIYLVDMAGGSARDLGPGFDAEWSADGRAVVFTRLTTCIPYYSFYYYYGCPNRGLTVASTEGEEPVDITFGETDAGGTWHPDGESIAFTRGGQLHLVGRAGGGVTPILLPPGVHASDPSWSPDGASLAFTCEFESGNRDVCVVGSGGSGFSRLTDDPAHDAGPDWSPDGSSIAFVTSRFSGVTELALMPSAGGLPTRVSAGTPAARPSWLDASTLVFAGVQCDVYAGCTPRGVFRVSLDGSGLTQLTTDADHEPSWRP
jgi:Tol biopolymer transport system component